MGDRQATIEFYLDADGDHRWHIVAANGRVISESSEGYKSKQDCEHAAEVTARTLRNYLEQPAEDQGDGNTGGN